MVKLIKSTFLEVVFKIESGFVTTIKEKMNYLLQSGTTIELDCIYDTSLFGKDVQEVKGRIFINIQEEEVLSKMGKGISLALDSDSIELILSLLDKYEKGIEFMPEICELSVKPSKKEVTLILSV